MRPQSVLVCLESPDWSGGRRSRLARHAPPRSGLALRGWRRSGPIRASSKKNMPSIWELKASRMSFAKVRLLQASFATGIAEQIQGTPVSAIRQAIGGGDGSGHTRQRKEPSMD